MSKLQKAALTVDGNNVHMSMPFGKVDKEKRTVSGFATLNNVDSQGDIVLAEASAKAFSRARGNLREMHDKIAVGRIVDFREDEFYDPTTQEFYRGIFVTAHVSKGAENTWLKVLDGTLSGFSIGGEIIDADSEFVKDADGGKGKSVRFIKDYDLVELSLVDNPANQLANVFSIQKSATGSVTVTGMVAETVIENVFYCKKDATIQSKTEESANCPECGKKMEVAGWFENTGDRAEKVREIVSKHLAVDENANGEGGVEMANANETTEPQVPESVATGHEEGDPQEVPSPAVDATTAEPEAQDVDETAGTDEEVEKAADVEEVTDDETEISKKIDELKEVVSSSLSKVSDESKELITELDTKINALDETFAKRFSELDQKLSSYDEKLETTKSRLAGLEESLEKFNSAEAFKKSADLDDEPVERVQKKSAWNGAFSLNDVLR